MREPAEDPAGMGIAQTTMLFSGGALAHRRVSRVPAPRQLRQIAEDHTIVNPPSPPTYLPMLERHADGMPGPFGR